MGNNIIITSPSTFVFLLGLVILFGFDGFVNGQIGLGSRLLARENRVWVSQNGTFALGFTQIDGNDRRLILAIWFNELPGDRTIVWSPNRNSPVNKDAVLELNTAGDLVLFAGDTVVWNSNTSRSGVQSAAMGESGNFVLLGDVNQQIWQSFQHPSDTLLPNQPLSVTVELSTPKSPVNGSYYALKMRQQPTSLSLALTYNLLSETHNSSPESYSNYSYWEGPDISNVTGDVTAVLNAAGSFGIVYGESSDGSVYVYKNDEDSGTLSGGGVRGPAALRRVTLEPNGNLRLYRWDDDVNGSRQWVPEWAAASKPCDIAGICGNGICTLDKSQTNASCSCLPGTSTRRSDGQCSERSPTIGKCADGGGYRKQEFRMSMVNQTNYYYSDAAVIANYSDFKTVNSCGDACLTSCQCIASVYGFDNEKPYCWVLRSLDFGGYENTGSTLFVKVRADADDGGDSSEENGGGGGGKEKVLVIPIVLGFVVLIVLLSLLLYFNVHRKRVLKRALQTSLILSGTPINFTYRDLQIRTLNFSQVLGTGGFGTVYKGSLADGTLIAVKKLDKVLPQGEKEFITEVNTIGSMHHMHLVRLCGYSSEGQHRALVYEFMKNGSLDKWIFPSNYSREKVLDWPTRYHIAVATAQGISYFHEQCRDRIIHCDIKPENILLDDNFEPKVSDFGLAKMMGREHSHVVTMVRGTRGYLAPEWISNRPITVKADVYSYGMLLLEIVGGRRNLDMSFDAEEFFYPGWAFKQMTNGTPLKAADKRVEGTVVEEEMERALKVAFWCIQDEVFIRPTMGDVVRMLEGSIDVNTPPMPQTVLELIEEGLDHVYKAMKRDFNNFSSLSTLNTHPSSRATCSYSTMSPR